MDFLFDANMPARLAKGLALIDRENLNGNVINIFHVDDLLGMGATDEQVILKANEINAVIVSEDSDFKTVRRNKELVKKLKVGYVLYKPPSHGSRYWEKAISIILAWEKLKENVKKNTKPFMIKIDKKGEIHEETF